MVVWVFSFLGHNSSNSSNVLLLPSIFLSPFQLSCCFVHHVIIVLYISAQWTLTHISNHLSQIIDKCIHRYDYTHVRNRRGIYFNHYWKHIKLYSIWNSMVSWYVRRVWQNIYISRHMLTKYNKLKRLLYIFHWCNFHYPMRYCNPANPNWVSCNRRWPPHVP